MLYNVVYTDVCVIKDIANNKSTRLDVVCEVLSVLTLDTFPHTNVPVCYVYYADVLSFSQPLFKLGRKYTQEY